MSKKCLFLPFEELFLAPLDLSNGTSWPKPHLLSPFFFRRKYFLQKESTVFCGDLKIQIFNMLVHTDRPPMKKRQETFSKTCILPKRTFTIIALTDENVHNDLIRLVITALFCRNWQCDHIVVGSIQIPKRNYAQPARHQSCWSKRGKVSTPSPTQC